MARTRGVSNFSANYEVKIQGALDARTLVPTKSELLLDTTWKNDGLEYTYVGMIVSVWNDGVNNGIYRLTNNDYTNVANWDKLGTSGDISTLSTALSTEVSTRSSVDVSLSSSLSSEISSRTSLDASLSTSLSNTNSNISNNYVPITRTVNSKALNTNINLNYADVGACSNTDGRLADARPASDVYSWAKASTKPSYESTELTDQGSVFGNRTYGYQYVISNGQSFTASLNNIDYRMEKLHDQNRYVGGSVLGGPSQYFSTGSGSWPGGYTHIINNEIFINMTFRMSSPYGNSGFWYLLVDHPFFVPYSEQYHFICANVTNQTPSTRGVKIIAGAGGPTGYKGQIYVWNPTDTCTWNLKLHYTLDPIYWQSL